MKNIHKFENSSWILKRKLMDLKKLLNVKIFMDLKKFMDSKKVFEFEKKFTGFVNRFTNL